MKDFSLIAKQLFSLTEIPLNLNGLNNVMQLLRSKKIFNFIFSILTFPKEDG